MSSLTGSELLLYGGLAGMAFTVLAAAAAVIVMHILGKRLRALLEAEFGKKRH